ncbi:hypothetical protein TRFO_39669 [Tritrichomonas foetus]|uniref:E2F/DP family winged-helix DNA-binding domain-containing protein n=1 Tax=Tritrichomonas foetus TaxID=1144522 RepID=A0A1J4J450_9EUKA|nr:hypothetical protein TRFO_39669 [Tritrichomonas foetus]|eukprot:OHS94138.1 hypothetical protein TRFO_39669 [Tritrichomonas foetus]
MLASPTYPLFHQSSAVTPVYRMTAFNNMTCSACAPFQNNFHYIQSQPPIFCNPLNAPNPFNNTATATLPPNYDKFKMSITTMVMHAERDCGRMFTFTFICQAFQFQRRRLYDVINALEAIGCCKKASVDTIIWNGLRCIPASIRQSFLSYGFNRPDSDIRTLISGDESISMLHLTQSLVLSFIVLQQQTLDIKRVARFLSAENGRFKTTLCKLYQISYILEALGILMKSNVPGMLTLNRPYYFDCNTTPKINLNEFEMDDSIEKVSKVNKHSFKSDIDNSFSSSNSNSSDEADDDDRSSNPLSISNLLSRPKKMVCDDEKKMILSIIRKINLFHFIQ